MTALQNDPDTGETMMRFLKSLFDWGATFSALLVPALAGAVIGAFKRNRWRIGKRRLIFSIIMSATCGCGLAPLFGHIFKIPAPAASSLAFFLGIWGLEGLQVVQNALRSKVGDEKKNDEEDGC